MSKPTLYPYAYENDPAARSTVESIGAMPPNASYKRLDDHEFALARRMAPSDGTITRETFEFHMQWMRWRLAGRNSFIIGPEITDRIMRRVKAGDVPTAPVPPAYIEFEEPPVNFAASKALRAAMISRGVVGRITFLREYQTENTGTESFATTVYLPSVFGQKEIDHLRKGMCAARGGGGVSKDAMALARTMAGIPEGMTADWLEDPARHLDAIGRHARGRDGEPQMDVSAALYDKVYGTPEHRPNPLLAKAARIVLVAADEARRADAAYAIPRYLDTDAISRNWMESQDQPVDLRDDVVRLA